MGSIILGFHPAALLMTRVWFNYNRVFSGFKFIFSNSRLVHDRFRYCYSRPTSIRAGNMGRARWADPIF